MKAFISEFADGLKLQIAQKEKVLKVQEYFKTAGDLQLGTFLWSQ